MHLLHDLIPGLLQSAFWECDRFPLDVTISMGASCTSRPMLV